MGVIVAGANEALNLGLFERSYPGGRSFSGFVIGLAAVMAVSWALSVLVDRLDR